MKFWHLQINISCFLGFLCYYFIMQVVLAYWNWVGVKGFLQIIEIWNDVFSASHIAVDYKVWAKLVETLCKPLFL